MSRELEVMNDLFPSTLDDVYEKATERIIFFYKMSMHNGKGKLYVAFSGGKDSVAIRKEELPYCKLYDQGKKRLGCIGCPMAGREQRIKDFEEYPKFKDAYIRAFDRMLENRRKSGLETEWKTGNEVMEWWISK